MMNSSMICIVGLGYVGIPLLHSILTRTKSNVIGFDVSEEKIESLKNSTLPASLECYNEIFNYRERLIFTTKLPLNTKIDAFIICVPTPLLKDGSPDLSYVENAFLSISQINYFGSLISLESTVYPGCTRHIAESHLNVDECCIAYSPEREDPGNKEFNITNIPKLVSSYRIEEINRVNDFYGQFINKPIPVSSLEVAEFAKLLENTQRAVNISLMNELKQFSNHIGIDIYEIIEAANTKPFGFTKYTPGPGIGGHCIPIDPSYLSWASKSHGYYLDFIEQSAKVNAKLPRQIKTQVLSECCYRGINTQQSTALFIGVSYKPNIEDSRSSPSYEIISQLKGYFKNYYILDTYCKLESLKLITSIDEIPKDNLNIISLILTDHDNINYESVKNISRLIFDSRGRYSISESVIRI